ncbi:TPA: hypothetical protein ACJFY0_004623, partial [Salmonella enterica subsp. enterica serovar Senftenberg]
MFTPAKFQRLLSAPDLWSLLLRAGSDPTSCTCYHISTFYFTGCGLQRPPALLPRDRKTAPE